MLVESTSIIKDENPVRVRAPPFFLIHDGVWSMGNSRKTTQLIWLRNLLCS